MFQPLPEKLAPRRTALIVIDVENGFTSDESTLARYGMDMSEARAAVPKMNEMIRAAREAGIHVVYLRSVFDREMELPNLYAFWGPWEGLPIHDGSWEVEFYSELAQPRPEDVIVKKCNYDAFSDTPLDLHLRARGITTCVFIGIETCACVETSARHAFIKGYGVAIASDACASCGTSVEDSRQLHQASLKVLGVRFGSILTVQEIAEVWAQALATTSPGAAS